MSAEVLILGAVTGLTYSLLAAGLVLVYRSSKVINIGHAETGALVAAVMGWVLVDHGWPYWIAFPLTVLVGGLLGGAIELIVVRRLFTSSRSVLLIATIGLAQLLLAGRISLPDVENRMVFPSPLDWRHDVGSLVLRSEHFMTLLLAPAVLLGLGWALTRTRLGVAIRASAENPDAALLAGINPKRVSTVVWALAGALAALTLILVLPLRNSIVGNDAAVLGPGLLVRALAAALIADLRSMPRAVLGGVAIGIGEAVLFAETGDPGLVDLAVAATIVAIVMFRGGNETLATTVSTTAVRIGSVARRSLPWWLRRSRSLLLAGSVVVVSVAPFVFTTSEQLFELTSIAVFALIGVSLVVLTGWAGQLSLGQVAFVGLGAMTTSTLTERGVPFVSAIGWAIVVAAGAALVVGYPALRVRGLFLAVTTLAFAVAVDSWLLQTELFTRGERVARASPPEVLGVDLRDPRNFFWLCGATTIVVAWAVARVRDTGVGRAMIAVRENDRAAAAATLSPTASKLSAFALSGALSGLAGALYAGQRVLFQASEFSPSVSFQVLSMVVIGGIGSVGGAVLGSLYVVGLPALLGSGGVVGLVTSGLGLLLLVLYLPGGLFSLVERLGTVVAARTTRGDDSVEPGPGLPAVDLPEPAGDVPALSASGLCVNFGGNTAVDDVSLSVGPTEFVSLIGGNGAGKSTTLNALVGDTDPASGTVKIFGRRVDGWPSHRRARLGVARVFQDARLFPELTVHETVSTCLERRAPSELIPTLLGLPGARARDEAVWNEALAIVQRLGLDVHADRRIAELSTGTRRVVEIACIIAQRPRLILLDEPVAGVAQREVEALVPLLASVSTEMGAAVLLIEHDMGVVRSLSDRVYCLDSGSVLVAGDPESVLIDPRVLDSYLGRSGRGVGRSDAVAVAP